jgi:hypothetical protein
MKGLENTALILPGIGGKWLIGLRLDDKIEDVVGLGDDRSFKKKIN